MLAYDFPLLSIFWVLLVSYFVFTVLFAVVWAFVDNFRRHDHGGWAKAGWAALILIFPFFGMLIYLVARPTDIFETRRDTTTEDRLLASARR